MSKFEILVKMFGSLENARYYAEHNNLISKNDFDDWKANDEACKKARMYAAPRHGHSRVGKRLQWHS